MSESFAIPFAEMEIQWNYLQFLELVMTFQENSLGAKILPIYSKNPIDSFNVQKCGKKTMKVADFVVSKNEWHKIRIFEAHWFYAALVTKRALWNLM